MKFITYLQRGCCFFMVFIFCAQAQNIASVQPLKASNINQLDTQKKPPNIIYILADDMGQGDTSSFNPKSKIITPNLEEMAKQGIKLTNFHSNSSVCTPTRYGILTGRYAWRTSLKQGVLNGHSSALIPPTRATVASLLKQHGYRTAAIGKWHLGMEWSTTDGKPTSKNGKNIAIDQVINNTPLVNGFDYFYGISASLNMNPHFYIENNKPQGEMVYLADDKAVKSAGLVGANPGWMAQGFRQDQVQKTFVNKTINWIKHQQKIDKNQPFFVYLALNSPHSPIVPSKKFVGKSGLSAHGDFVVEMDFQIGRLLALCDELKIADNTLIIFTADNGTSPKAGLKEMQAKGHYSSLLYRGLKGSLYEGGHRVPFIAKWPAVIKPGSSSGKLGSLVDLFATVADINAFSLADNMGEDSVSMLPIFKNDKSNQARRGVVYHSDKGFFAITKGQWKLILHPDAGSKRRNPKDRNHPVKHPADVQLFNIYQDPSERVNVQKAYPNVVKKLTKQLEIYIANGRSTVGSPQRNDAIDEATEQAWQKQQSNYLNVL